MSDDGQESATSTNADVMGEVMQGSGVATTEAAARQYSIGDASMIAQIGDTNTLIDNSPISSQHPFPPDLADTETPKVKPDAVDSRASPLKPTQDLPNTTNIGQGHAKQDLSEKLDDAAPEHTSQADDNTAEQDTSTVASSAAREASGTDAGHTTPHSAFQNHNGDSGYSNATNGLTDAEGVSVKKLIQRRSSESEGKAADAKEQQTPPARRKTEDELPEGIRALKTRFSGASPSNNTPSPQPIPLPKEANQAVAPLVHLEVEHKPGSKYWPYKELTGLRIGDGIDPTCKEEYLTEDDFCEVFKKWDVNRTQFKAQPVWRQRIQKQTVGLF